jgi:hypothetical protein
MTNTNLSYKVEFIVFITYCVSFKSTNFYDFGAKIIEFSTNYTKNFGQKNVPKSPDSSSRNWVA